MSAEDAENINAQINDVYSNTANIAKSLKNQTSIIKTTITQFETDLIDKQKKNRCVNKHIK